MGLIADDSWTPFFSVEKFWSNVEKTDGCWLWTAGKDGHGYGHMYVAYPNGKRREVKVTRVSWFIKHGYLDESKAICHDCDNTACVNPDHLLLATMVYNSQDMMRKARGRGQFIPKSHCKQGHPLEGDNVNIVKHADGYEERRCRICVNLNASRVRQKKREAHVR